MGILIKNFTIPTFYLVVSILAVSTYYFNQNTCQNSDKQKGLNFLEQSVCHFLTEFYYNFINSKIYKWLILAVLNFILLTWFLHRFRIWRKFIQKLKNKKYQIKLEQQHYKNNQTSLEMLTQIQNLTQMVENLVKSNENLNLSASFDRLHDI